MSAARAVGDVAVIGGGWAGLAAAVTLAEGGAAVTLFETGQTLGGRARRLDQHGIALDNGQHLLLGAYRDTLALMHKVQPARAPETLYWRTPLCLTGPGAFRLRAARLPAPLHMVAALLTARGCTIGERFAVIRAFGGWRRNAWRTTSIATVAELLQDQPSAMLAQLWTPLCLAALNTPPASASAQVFLNVIRDALAAGAAASDLIIPAADLSALFPDPAARFVEEHGGHIRRGVRVRTLAAADCGITLELAGPDQPAQCFRHVLVATAPWQASGLLKDLPAASAIRAQIDDYDYQPITTVYLRYDRPVPVAGRMIQLANGPGQWLFDRSIPGSPGGMLAVVISTEGAHSPLTNDALVNAIVGQLAANLPGLDPGAMPAWTRVISERRATHACTPARTHPRAGHIGSGVYLAGDHTDPDYPATLEAAVRSGIRAAQAVLSRR
jgi:squalene-associated FAD-dependent desaturase